MACSVRANSAKERAETSILNENKKRENTSSPPPHTDPTRPRGVGVFCCVVLFCFPGGAMLDGGPGTRCRLCDVCQRGT